ncbi:hypothetical protein [Roseomonas elaeocarpi]|uniref:Uncharacterized protein n=1 Tax=Roseomonas elaeocarpi TaxID=907779 RepID=A0ABV6JRX9_9PROT
MKGWQGFACSALLTLSVLAQPAWADRPQVDRSGREQQAHAFVYRGGLPGVNPDDVRGGAADLAASNSLPVGTTARVTNPRNGRWALVRVRATNAGEDGPALNVSSRVADRLGFAESGSAPVVIAPLAVPQADGTIVLGQGTGLAGQQAAIVHPERS